MDGTAHDVAIIEPYALIAVCEAGLQVLDICDPAQPVLVGAVALPATPSHPAVTVDDAYVVGPMGGLDLLTLTVQ